MHTRDAGLHWEIQSIPVELSSLFSVHFTDSKRGWIVGLDGLILHTEDGGDHWVE
jgi:photosystem II stability/assembly factor-like uncharacterized protein